MSRTVIIDYGFCNLDSVLRAVQECGGEADVSEDPASAATAGRLILPGVGNYAEAMKEIRRRGWDVALRQEVLGNGIPLMGICLGMQLLATMGIEGGETEGLGLIHGRVIRLERSLAELRVPHIGWNEIRQKQPSPLFHGIPDGRDFYFVHSYHFVPDDKRHILGTTPYGIDFVSVVGNRHIIGTQFHPEKSLRAGARLIRNFLEAF